MPSTILPPVRHHVPPTRTKENLDYADLAVIDLSKAHTPEGRALLAIELCDAIAAQGFFYAINHGYTQAQNDRMFDIANVPFSLADEEKRLYTGNVKESGTYQGFKPRQLWHIDGGVHDQVEHYNINRDVTKRQHPKAMRPFLPEIEAFAQFNHYSVVHTILRLLALGLGLPEDTLVDQHNFSAAGESSVRFMNYYPRTGDEETKTNNVWLKGHTDIGSITVLWSQPIAGLQILSPDGKWRWIKHIDNALVINAGDALELLSGGAYKATIHRVVQPPPDQCACPRLGVFYFAMPDDGVCLVPHARSSVGGGERVGAPTMEAWRKGRTAAYGLVPLRRRADGVEEETVEGVVVRHYN
ncbi:Clavaminate synthase-like protein [Sparassis latifolia]